MGSYDHVCEVAFCHDATLGFTLPVAATDALKIN
jgi:hypothetical protein